MDDTAISSNEYKMDLYKRMLDKGRLLWANQPPVRLMGGIKFPFQTETGYFDYICRSHIYTPVAWNDYKNCANIEDLASNIRMNLRLAALTVCDEMFGDLPNYPTSLSKMYPMTPQELHEGYILGPNKIITIGQCIM